MNARKSRANHHKTFALRNPSLKQRTSGEVWRKNFDIRRCDYNLPYESLIGFTGEMMRKTLSANPIKEAVWVFRNGDCEGCYLKISELRRAIAMTVEKILRAPARVDRVHKKATELNWQLFYEAERIRGLNFREMSDKRILTVHRRLYKIIHISHMWAIATTWFLDSDGEDYSKYLLEFLRQRIKALGLSLDLPSAFSVLTTPKEKSFLQKEEEESLRLLARFRKSAKVKHWFVSHTTEELVKTLDKIPRTFRQMIIKHHRQWLWLPYTYTGPAWGLDYFLEVWRGLLHEDVDPQEKLAESRAKKATVQKRRASVIKQLKLTAYEKHLFAIAADIVWLKGFRKDTYFYAFYSLDLLLSEVARRSGLTLMQAKYLVPGDPMAKSFKARRGDIPQALAGKDFSKITSGRIKFSIFHAVSREVRVLAGSAAKKFLSSLHVEKIKVVKTNLLAGTCACPGKAIGITKIINVPEDMPKMKAGDIMLAHTTFPALVPAMKKAAAIITEDGGITCHAAIVARELQTPCVVGVKNLLVQLKDGDRVKVDANNGTVKRI